MSRPTRRPGRAETLISVAVVAALACIAAEMIMRQINYKPAWLAGLDASTSASPEATEPAAAPAADEGGLAAYAGYSLAAMSPQESFTPDTLYEKIDGRAELYLTAGFVSLRCQRFSPPDNPEAWLELYVYNMGDSDNAYTVYTKQKRPGVTELGERAYRTSNALYFAHGKFYVEIVASQPDEALLRAMDDIRRRFDAEVPGGGEKLAPEVSLFPRPSLVPASISRSTAEDFGIEGFDGVYLAVYRIDGQDVTAFLSRRSSPKEASDLAAAYIASFKPFGARVEPAGQAVPGGTIVVVLDTYKVVFTRGEFLAGVHECTDRGAAVKVAAMLYGALAEADK